MFWSFSFDHPQWAICRALCRYHNVFRWFAFVEYLLGMWLYVYIICNITLQLEWNTRNSLFTSHILDIMNFVEFILTEQLHYRWYTHTATYQANTQRTQISRRHYSNDTQHGIWPPEDGRIKSTETCRGLLTFTNTFLTF